MTTDRTPREERYWQHVYQLWLDRFATGQYTMVTATAREAEYAAREADLAVTTCRRYGYPKGW